jgi:hypothetical protein
VIRPDEGAIGVDHAVERERDRADLDYLIVLGVASCCLGIEGDVAGRRRSSGRAAANSNIWAKMAPF